MIISFIIFYSKSLFLNFHYLVSVTVSGLVSPPWAYLAKFYGRLWLIRSVWRVLIFYMFKLTEIVIAIAFVSAYCGTFGHLFRVLNVLMNKLAKPCMMYAVFVSNKNITSASYLDLLLSTGKAVQLNTSFNNKRDDSKFHITNFPFLISYIPFWSLN